MINYSFNSKTAFDNLIYRINVEPPFEMLYDLSSGYLKESKNVEGVLKEIEAVKEGKTEMYSFGGSDYCILDVYKNETKVYYDFGENETVIQTSELKQLLTDWKDYLIKNGQ